MTKKWQFGAMYTVLCVTIVCCGMTDCSQRERDPVVEIRGMVPKIEEALNRRAIGDLRGLGTRRLEANRFIMECFGGREDFPVVLRFRNFKISGTVAQLELGASFESPEPSHERTLNLTLHDTGHWEIDSFEFSDDQP